MESGSKLFLGLVLAVLGPVFLYPEPRIQLATHDQAPLSYLDDRGVPVGSAVRPVEWALEAMGWKYDIQVVPWNRAQSMVKNGTCDGFFAASQSEDRDLYASASEPIGYQTTNWYLLKGNRLDPRTPDFKEKASVAGYQGSNMLSWLRTQGYKVSGTPPDPDQLFTMLALGRFDACLANEYNLHDFLAKNRSSKDLFRAVVKDSTPLYVYLSKKFLAAHPRFLAQFNKYLRDYLLKNS